MNDELLVTTDGAVRIVTINRPDDLNVVNAALHHRLLDVWRDLERDRDARCVVLTGAGKTFSGGGDFAFLKAQHRSLAYRYEISAQASDILHAMINFRLPVVAAVNGPAIGLGASLALCCDLVLMSERSYLCDPHVSIGLTAGDGGALLWPYMTSLIRAKEYVYTGERISAALAVELGLANRVVSPEALMDDAMQLAGRLAAQPARALQTTKRAFSKHLAQAAIAIVDYGLAAETLELGADDHIEKVREFLGDDKYDAIPTLRREMNTDWRTFPFRLVSGDRALDFPAAEGVHADQESDTWFIAGELTGETGRKFAYLAIFNKNRPGGTVVADFYTMALFDCDTGEYGTYTDYDMPPKNMQPGAQPKMTMATGYLDIRYESTAGPVAWTSCRDDDGALRPYAYQVSLRGLDQAGQAMELDLDVTPTRAPVPVGANTYDGKIICFGQPDTYSYFQTGMAMNGTLRWGEQYEEVSGSAGHVDRQWFPKYAGGGGSGGDPRSRSHEWRTINLDNGIDMSIWHQFDRLDGNALQPFSGATVSYPDPSKPPECAEDVEVTVNSYVRWPNSIRPLVRPPAPDRFMPNLHRLRSAALELDLTGEPLVPAPAHGLPIEYMEGPYRYHGTMRGEPVSGFAFYERSLALYRDWELIDVLASTLDDPSDVLDQLRSLVAAGKRADARKLLQDNLTTLPTSSRDVAETLIEVLSRDS